MTKGETKMKGYTSIKQFVEDIRLYNAAKMLNVARDDGGETLKMFIKKRIDERLSKASKQFNSKGYSKQELMFIATHDSFRKINNIDEFVSACFDSEAVSKDNYKKIFLSKPFKEGKLAKLYAHLPLNVSSKTDLWRFIKMSGEINKNELESIMDSLYEKKWRIWLSELLDEGKLKNSMVGGMHDLHKPYPNKG